MKARKRVAKDRGYYRSRIASGRPEYTLATGGGSDGEADDRRAAHDDEINRPFGACFASFPETARCFVPGSLQSRIGPLQQQRFPVPFG